jgi:hypothetical protein
MPNNSNNFIVRLIHQYAVQTKSKVNGKWSMVRTYPIKLQLEEIQYLDSIDFLNDNPKNGNANVVI